MATTDGSYPSAGSTVSYNFPEYYNSSGAAVAGGLQDMLGTNGYVNNTLNNWYSTAPGQGALGQYATYSQGGMNQYMNPYVGNVVDEQARLSNQNLFESVLPGVNSTFTGAGQFGSTRNADFTNRAIRDQGYNLAGQQGQTLFNAQNQANTNYQNWTQMGLGAAQNDLGNWVQQAQFPIQSMGALGQVLGQMRPSQPSSVSTQGPTPTNLDKLASVLGILNNGLNDSTINNLLNWAGLSGALSGSTS
jgi:hypothetical protein